MCSTTPEYQLLRFSSSGTVHLSHTSCPLVLGCCRSWATRCLAVRRSLTKSSSLKPPCSSMLHCPSSQVPPPPADMISTYIDYRSEGHGLKLLDLKQYLRGHQCDGPLPHNKSSSLTPGLCLGVVKNG